MKSLLKLFWILGVSLIALSFTACSDDDDDPKSAESALLEMKFDDDIVTVQPIITSTDIKFFVAYDATEEDLKEMVPTITVSNKATVNPASGSKVDFSGDPVKFTVTAEDGVTKTVYTVTCQRIDKYDFEEWIVENSGEEEKSQYSHPVGNWSSSNPGAALLILFGFTDQFPVSKTEEAYSGNGAAKMVTLDTKGISLSEKIKIPKITSGSLYLGKFRVDDVDIENTLRNTMFGIPFSKKPISVRGFYKYTPGEIYYICENPEAINIAVEDKNKTDECAINAVLYEIESDNDEYLTGADVYTSDKLVAIAKLEDGSVKADYTPFSIKMEYKKPYDPTKKYRMSIICSSSAAGDTFSGAPGSVLYVDDIEVISE